MFRVNPKTVTRWARAGKITAIRTLGGHRRFRQSDRLLMFLIRAYGPDCFRNSGRDRSAAPAATPVAEALAYLHPAPPPEPAALMAPDDLAVALEVADLCDGDLPPWHRDRREEPLDTGPIDQAFAALVAREEDAPQG